MHKAMLSRAAGLTVTALTLVATFAPTIDTQVEVVSALDQIVSGQTHSAPMIMAQGRCFNGKCF